MAAFTFAICNNFDGPTALKEAMKELQRRQIAARSEEDRRRANSIFDTPGLFDTVTWLGSGLYLHQGRHTEAEKPFKQGRRLGHALDRLRWCHRSLRKG